VERRLATSLVIAQLVSVATVLRSVAFDRWITVLAGGLLFLGATAGMRGKTWGIALALMSAVAFPVAFLIGIAPPWFALVGLAGIMPFLISLPAFTKFDKKATALLVAIASVLGTVGAVGWKAVAWDVFGAIPALTPSIFAEHPFLVAAIAAAGVHITVRSYQGKAKELPTGARVAVDPPISHVRIAADVDESEFEEELPKPAAKRRAS
jgi:hypothetical protein